MLPGVYIEWMVVCWTEFLSLLVSVTKPKPNSGFWNWVTIVLYAVDYKSIDVMRYR